MSNGILEAEEEGPFGGFIQDEPAPPAYTTPFDPAWVLKVDELETETREGMTWTAEGHREYTRKFLVLLNHNIYELRRMGGITVCKAPGLPYPYSPYTTEDSWEFDLLAVAVRFRASRPSLDYPFRWIVEVTYSTQVPEGGVGPQEMFGDDYTGGQNQPDMKPWHLEWEPDVITRVPSMDLVGRPFLNSAKTPFATPYQQEEGRANLIIVRNMIDFGRRLITKYSFATNDDWFLGAAPGTVRCRPPRGTIAYLGKMRYWKTKWVLEFGAMKPYMWQNPDTGEAPPAIPADYDELEAWDEVDVLDQGFCHLSTNPLVPVLMNKPVPILRYGQQITQPDLLDGNGQPVEPDVDGYRKPVFLKFTVRRRLNFAQLFEQGLNYLQDGQWGLDLEG